MNEWSRAFEPYLLAGQIAKQFETEFKTEPVLAAATLKRDDALEKILMQYRDAAGIYFWVMAYKAARYSIYIGQTKSLSRRLCNYVSRFQVHSPNDYKLQVFRAFVTGLAPPGALDLYFAEKDANVLSKAETVAEKQYRPLLNHLPKPTKEERSKLKEAFSLYYRSALKRKLKK